MTLSPLCTTRPARPFEWQGRPLPQAKGIGQGVWAHANVLPAKQRASMRPGLPACFDISSCTHWSVSIAFPGTAVAPFCVSLVGTRWLWFQLGSLAICQQTVVLSKTPTAVRPGKESSSETCCPTRPRCSAMRQARFRGCERAGAGCVACDIRHGQTLYLGLEGVASFETVNWAVYFASPGTLKGGGIHQGILKVGFWGRGTFVTGSMELKFRKRPFGGVESWAKMQLVTCARNRSEFSFWRIQRTWGVWCNDNMRLG